VFVRSVEDVRSVDVHHHPGRIAFGEAVPRYVAAGVEDGDAVAVFCEFTGHDRTRETGANDGKRP
jgi:hypothetical protein